MKAIVYCTRVNLRQKLVERINGTFIELKQDKHKIRKVINSISLRDIKIAFENENSILKWKHKLTFTSNIIKRGSKAFTFNKTETTWRCAAQMDLLLCAKPILSPFQT